MELDKYIKIYDNVISKEHFERLLQADQNNILNFEQGKIVGDKEQVIETDVRKTDICNLYPMKKSLTEVYWYHLFLHVFKKHMFQYCEELQTSYVPHQISDISILKYTHGGHYVFHVDHCGSIPRTLSMILLVNNNYDGGRLTFKNPLNEEIQTIEPSPGRLIIWPSTFMYPHKVTPVTKGTRYSIVCWAR